MPPRTYGMAKLKKRLTLQIAGEDMEWEDFSFIAGKNAKWTATLDDSLAVSNKSIHCLTI